MMPSLRRIFLPCLASLLFCAAASAQVIGPDDLRPDPEGMPDEQAYRGEIKITPSLSLPVTIHVTTKGNGQLTIANLQLHVYDNHDNGLLYEDHMLRVEFTDIDRDGDLDLVVSGTAVHTDDKGIEVIRRETIVRVYVFDQARKEFVRTYSAGSLKLDG